MNFKTLYKTVLKQTSITTMALLYGFFLVFALLFLKWTFVLAVPYAFLVGTTIMLLNTYNVVANIYSKCKKIDSEKLYVLNMKNGKLVTRYFFIAVDGKKIKQLDFLFNEIKPAEGLSLEALENDYITLSNKDFYVMKMK
jgi:hypothetical protein